MALSLPWFKFSAAAWRGDQALRAVSLAARGLWIDCLCIMHEAKPYGHLTLNGTAIDDDTLARMTGTPVEAVQAHMAELRKAGVLSVTVKGVVFSRRMTKDFAQAQKGRKAASKRWSQATENTPQSDDPNGVANGSPNAQEKLDTEDGRIPPKPPRGRSRQTRGAQVFLSKAKELGDGNERPEAGIGSDRPDAGRVPDLAIGYQRIHG